MTTSKIPVSHPSVGNEVGQAHLLPFVVEVRPEAANVPLDEVLDRVGENGTWREEQLHRAGAILFRGFSALRTAEDFAALAQRMAPEILDYAGGTTPRSAVTGKIVTSTAAPRHVVIGLRQELSYPAPSPDFPTTLRTRSCSSAKPRPEEADRHRSPTCVPSIGGSRVN